LYVPYMKIKNSSINTTMIGFVLSIEI
jgi:hypothetical protein